jgi:hypothetical protein
MLAIMAGGNVCPRSQISMSLEIFSFWFSGAFLTKSLKTTGSASRTIWTPDAYVPGAALLDTAWPAFFAFSTHCRMTESTTYSTPSLCVAGLLEYCRRIFSMRILSYYK